MLVVGCRRSVGVLVASVYGVVAVAQMEALRAAGVTGTAPANAGAITKFVSTITDNALWMIGTIATLAVVVIGGLFFFGHSRAQDYAAKILIGAVIIVVRAGHRGVSALRLAVRRCRRRGAARDLRRGDRGRCWPRGGGAAPSAHAADLFPVDDWLGSGLKAAGDVVLGPLKVGAEEIARLLVTIVGALADLLVPKSLVKRGPGRDPVAGASSRRSARRSIRTGRRWGCGCRTCSSCGRC